MSSNSSMSYYEDEAIEGPSNTGAVQGFLRITKGAHGGSAGKPIISDSRAP